MRFCRKGEMYRDGACATGVLAMPLDRGSADLPPRTSRGFDGSTLEVVKRSAIENLPEHSIRRMFRLHDIRQRTPRSVVTLFARPARSFVQRDSRNTRVSTTIQNANVNASGTKSRYGGA
jgi:hypothetical protein